MSYQPKIKPEQMKDLYFIKEYTGIPITKLIADALNGYIPKFKREIQRGEELSRNKEVKP